MGLVVTGLREMLDLRPIGSAGGCKSEVEEDDVERCWAAEDVDASTSRMSEETYEEASKEGSRKRDRSVAAFAVVEDSAGVACGDIGGGCSVAVAARAAVEEAIVPYTTALCVGVNRV